MPWIEPVMCFAGAAFLCWYGMLNFKNALDPAAQGLRPAQGEGQPFGHTILTCLALIWLNPHVYLDTLALVGAVSTKNFPWAKFSFGAGAVTASFLFFPPRLWRCFSAAFFMKPRNWRMLELAIACMMWLIAFYLVRGYVL